MAISPVYYDPQRALTEDWRTFFYDHKDDMFILPCIEGDVEIQGNWMLLNIMLTLPLILRKRPISRDRHLMLSGIYTASSHAKRMTEIVRSLEEAGYTREQLGHDIIMTANNAHNLCYTHLGSHVKTIDIFSIARTVLDPKAKPICTMDYGDITDRNIKRMEKAFKDQCVKVDELLSGDSLEFNAFRSSLVCGALKKGQFYQFILSAGPRTDTNDDLFLRPVVGSFLSGFKGIMDLAIESRSASKSTHYNKTQMAQAQYGNRKLHILNSVMHHLYPGDCGSTTFMTYGITDAHKNMYLGKWYQGDDGQLIEITKDRFPEIVGKRIKVREVIGCLHTDGYCEVCGGTITKSFSKTGNVGFLSIVKSGAPVAQQVLSTKHLTSTDAAEYELPDVLKDIFMSSTNDILLLPHMRRKIKAMALGFTPDDISKINDLKYVQMGSDITASYFSAIKYLQLGMLNQDGSITHNPPRVPMGGDSKIWPHLSPEILNNIRENPEDIVMQDGIAWLLLRNINPDLPIMRCTVTNNSIKLFVNEFAALVTKHVERYQSINDFMQHLTDLIWTRVSSHVTHVACLARACLITSKRDFNIPVVTDPDDVMFSTLNRIIPMRSIGGLYAFERIDTATNKPITYITPKRTGILDEFMGYTDIIERDMNWPVPQNSPLIPS
jgi:hypothetical protein